MNESRYWLWFVGSAPPRSPLAKPIAEAAERRRDRPVHAADDDAREHDDRVAEREVGRDERVLHGEHHGDHRGEGAREQHRDGDHAVRAHAEHARRLEVHRRRAHVQTDRPCARAAAAGASRQSAATITETIVILRMSTVEIVHGRFR